MVFALFPFECTYGLANPLESGYTITPLQQAICFAIAFTRGELGMLGTNTSFLADHIPQVTFPLTRYYFCHTILTKSVVSFEYFRVTLYVLYIRSK